MKSSEPWQRSQDLSAASFRAVRDLLPDGDASTIREYIYEASEWGLGVEAIIDTLLEYNVVISQVQKHAIDAAAESMGLDRGQAKLHVCEP